jgi:hypothetical protein
MLAFPCIDDFSSMWSPTVVRDMRYRSGARLTGLRTCDQLHRSIVGEPSQGSWRQTCYTESGLECSAVDWTRLECFVKFMLTPTR